MYRLALAAMENAFGVLDNEQKESLAAIVAANAKYNPNDNGAQLAYILATAWHESRLKPVRECFGKTDAESRHCIRNRSYAVVVNGHVYYGRGFVQLTWYDNYVRMGKELGVDLASYPDLALQPAIAAQILVVGMVKGMFTGKKLSDYISNDGMNDYWNARRIVNGTDRAQLINDYAVAIVDYREEIV
jgi:hypothetical protein